MGELKTKYNSAQKAVGTFEEIFDEEYSVIVRDAAIQRFEYSYETIWKLIKRYLQENEGVVANSPKSVFREALSNNILSVEEAELALVMTDDRIGPRILIKKTLPKKFLRNCLNIVS